MQAYAFILGRKHLLSVAEILNLLELEEHDKVIDISTSSLIAALHKPLDNAQNTLNQMGGIIKIAQIEKELSLQTDIQEVANQVAEILIKQFENHETKFNYAVSTYLKTQTEDNYLKRLLNLVKKGLKEANLKSRFINKNFKNPENAALKGEKIVEKGAEIIIIEGKNNLFIAKTNALQDFEDYGNRDYNRPARDARLGMLPPKLSQIMINICGMKHIQDDKSGKTLLDPFCGVGTILTEGMLLGYNAIGSDISQEVIQKCQKNVDWTKTNYYLPQLTCQLFVKDATTLNKNDLKTSPDLVVTEGYLGPPQTICPEPHEIEHNFTKILDTSVRFFKALHPLIKTGTPVVMSFPFYKRRDRNFYITKIAEKISQQGYKVHELIPEELATKYNLRTYGQQSLVYDRPDQVVGREIYKFTKI